MLPAPISFTGRRRRSFTVSREIRPWRNLLLVRSRATNLTLFLLLLLLSVSAFVHLRTWLFYPTCTADKGITHATKVPKSIADTIHHSNPQNALRKVEHLIMVPGHSIWTGSRIEEALDENFWLLESYQRGSGRVDAFVEHIRQG